MDSAPEHLSKSLTPDPALQAKDDTDTNTNHTKTQETAEKVATQASDLEAGASSLSRRNTEIDDRLGSYQLRIVSGLFFPAVIQGLNSTMIVAALPVIASEFHSFAESNWITTSFNLTSATFIPVWGQFADIFGRYYTLQLASIIQLVGCALCAGAPVNAFPMLLVGRSLQGLSSAGYSILTATILADRVSLKSNARTNSLFGFIHGIGYSVGPVLGGYLTQVNWRWCFIIIIPLAVIALVVVHLWSRPVLLGAQALPNTSKENGENTASSTMMQRLSSIDVVGQLLFLFGIGLIILALTWAGATYTWTDIRVLIPLIIGVILTAIFCEWEYLFNPGKLLRRKFPKQQPMIPAQLLWTRNAGLLVYVNFMTGMAMFAVYYFVAIYFTIIKNYQPGESGRSLLFYIPGLAVGTYIALFCCNIWPKQTWHPLALGTIIEAVGITVLAYALTTGSVAMIWGIVALAGAGTGARLMPGTLHGVGYFRQQIAAVVSLMTLAGAFGGIVSSTLMFNIFNNKMTLAGYNFARDGSTDSLLKIIQQLPPDVQEDFRKQALNAIVLAFYAISAFMWFGVIPVAFLGNVKIVGSKKSEPSSDSNLCEGAYLGQLFRRTGAAKQSEK